MGWVDLMNLQKSSSPNEKLLQEHLRDDRTTSR